MIPTRKRGGWRHATCSPPTRGDDPKTHDQSTYVDAPWLASLTSYRSRWQSGQVRSYVRPLGAALRAAGPYGVVRSDPNRKRGLDGPSASLLVFPTPVLPTVGPYLCPPSCLPSPVGTFPARAHAGNRAVKPRRSPLSPPPPPPPPPPPGLRDPANACLLHRSDSQLLRYDRNGLRHSLCPVALPLHRHGPDDARHPVGQSHRSHLPRLLVQHPAKARDR